MSELASAATDWLGSVSAALIGTLGLGVTAWQWRASGFRPVIHAEIDPRGQAIRLQVRNKGRGSGVIDDVTVVEGEFAVKDVRFEGFPDQAFDPLSIPAFTEIRIIIMAPDDGSFPLNDLVKVHWGGKSKFVRPTPVKVGLWGLRSILPPK
jgi:hypothetical protein